MNGGKQEQADRTLCVEALPACKGWTDILPYFFLAPLLKYLIYQFSSVAQLYPTLCNPMDYSTPGLPVHHQLLEFTQTHVH